MIGGLILFYDTNTCAAIRAAVATISSFHAAFVNRYDKTTRNSLERIYLIAAVVWLNATICESPYNQLVELRSTQASDVLSEHRWLRYVLSKYFCRLA
jgi:uncharacterized sodium:solute symporter family permease YidK